jgi:hypothetical protein
MTHQALGSDDHFLRLRPFRSMMVFIAYQKKRQIGVRYKNLMARMVPENTISVPECL